MDYATVSLHDAADASIITGITTEGGGIFQLESPKQEVYLMISFIGFESKKIDNITFTNKKADLGSITLGADSQVLDEVTVTADKSTTEFKLDKRVFNVGSDLSSTGASALES